MTNIIKQNHSGNFPNPNEGKVNSKGMVAPPVLQKSYQAQFAGRRAIFEQNASHPQASDISNPGRTFGPRMQNLMKNHNIDTHGSTNKLNAREKADSAVSKSNVTKEKKVTFANLEQSVTPDSVTKRQPLSDHTEYMMRKEREVQKSNPFKTLMGTMPLNTREQRSESTSSADSQSTASSVNDMLFGGINDSTPCLKPQRSGALNNRGFSPTMQRIIKNTDTAQKSEISSSANLTPVEKNINLFNNINEGLSNASHEQKPLSGVSKVNVKELANRFQEIGQPDAPSSEIKIDGGNRVKRLIGQFEQGSRGC